MKLTRLRPIPPSMRAALFSVILAAAVTACGYKGPLYLPKPKPAAQQQPASSATSEEKNNDSSRQ